MLRSSFTLFKRKQTQTLHCIKIYFLRDENLPTLGLQFNTIRELHVHSKQLYMQEHSEQTLNLFNQLCVTQKEFKPNIVTNHHDCLTWLANTNNLTADKCIFEMIENNDKFKCDDEIETNLNNKFMKLVNIKPADHAFQQIKHLDSAVNATLFKGPPKVLPSLNITKAPIHLPSVSLPSPSLSILDKNDLVIYYDCPPFTITTATSNNLIKCAWASTDYRYKRQRRVRNHRRVLSTTLKHRARRMRLHHRKKWLKKHKYTLLKKLREKIKRRGKLFDLENQIILGKAEQFNAELYVKRELEKAKFYGYRASSMYDDLRENIQRLKIDS